MLAEVEVSVEESEPLDTVMDFTEAMRAVRDGLSIFRKGWDEDTALVGLHNDRLSIRRNGVWMDWIVQREDLLARDWTV